MTYYSSAQTLQRGGRPYLGNFGYTILNCFRWKSVVYRWQDPRIRKKKPPSAITVCNRKSICSSTREMLIMVCNREVGVGPALAEAEAKGSAPPEHRHSATHTHTDIQNNNSCPFLLPRRESAVLAVPLCAVGCRQQRKSKKVGRALYRDKDSVITA